MGLLQQMRAMAEVIGPVVRDPEVRGRPRVGPRLVTGFAPSCLTAPQAPPLSDLDLLERAGFFARIRAEGAGPEGAEPPQGLGSSIARNWDRPPRYGFEGLTPAGRHNVSEALQLLEEDRSLLSFWTITLPTPVLLAIAERDSWPVFVKGVSRRLRRELIARLGAAVFVGAVELQPKRTAAVGIPCPHLHIVFRGRIDGCPWALKRQTLDGIIAASAAEAGCAADCSYASAGNVQRVKKSVRAYLSKYLTKGSSDARVWAGTRWEALIPRQWWLWSDDMRRIVRSATVQLPTEFLAWVWRSRHALLNAGLFYLQQCKVPESAPATYRIFWNRVDCLAAVMARWHESLWDELWMSRAQAGIIATSSGVVYGLPVP